MIQSKSKAILLLAIVFLLGIVIGASVGATFLSKRISTRTEPRPPRKEHLVDKFKSRLNLTDQQVGQLKAIFEEDNFYEIIDIIEKLDRLRCYRLTDDDSLYIGKQWHTIIDDETGFQFKNNIENLLKETLKKDVNCSTHQEAWYNG